MASFNLFCNLPVELQLVIWALDVPNPEPEVCIVWPLGIDVYADEEPALPFIVDTAWPAVAHPENALFGRDLRHIAVEVMATYPQSELAELIRQRARWVEVCKDRLLGGDELEDDAAPEPRRIPVTDRKNPEEYRVLDDDSGWYSTEEFKLTLQGGYTMELGMIPPGPYY
ncbi:hypothetical protein MFIFM68171_00157 [Madurella fahalii]|uniref:Uncharacterized protein n=1 Tax=Madurella fahalii TaxID=1157608 RepID=A0ABQ0FWR5_9PEZI